MLEFRKIIPEDRAAYQALLEQSGERGCEFSFANLCLWGRQRIAFAEGHGVLFSQFDRRTVYPFPVGGGEKKPVLDAIIADSRARGIPCRLTGLTETDIKTVQELYPGQFRFHCDRGSYDYVYAIEDLAELKGRKYQKKRNHIHRFEQIHPDYQILPLNDETRVAAYERADRWYADRAAADPHMDFHLEQLALRRAFVFQTALEMEGVVLTDGEQILAFAMGSRLNADTFDIHFEKALDTADGAYPVINREFARYLREKYPELRWLNREDDMGLEGLRKAKLSYYPDHMIEKYWARLWEEEDEH